MAEAGEVDILVANAALPAAGRLETFTTEEIDRALDVNLRAPIALAHALLPAMLARRRGPPACSSPRSRARPPFPATRSTTPRSSACAASPRGCAPTCTASGVGVSGRVPGLHPRRRHVRRRRGQAAAGRRHAQRPRTSRARVVRRSSATAPRLDVASSAPAGVACSVFSMNTPDFAGQPSRAGSADATSRARWSRALRESARRARRGPAAV